MFSAQELRNHPKSYFLNVLNSSRISTSGSEKTTMKSENAKVFLLEVEGMDILRSEIKRKADFLHEIPAI